jgi:hypothetical protein
LRVLDPCRKTKRAVRVVDDVVVIVAAAEPYLLVAAVPDAGADRMRRAEVERGTADVAAFAGRNERAVDRRIAVGVQREAMVSTSRPSS